MSSSLVIELRGDACTVVAMCMGYIFSVLMAHNVLNECSSGFTDYYVSISDQSTV